MNSNSSCKRSLFSLAAILSLCLLTSGCFHTGGKYRTSEPALNIISSIEAANTSLSTFKGIGSIKLINNNQPPASFRLAWAAQNPDKIRLLVLVSGKTIETFAADGKNIFLKSHTGTHKFLKMKSKNANLKRLISIPVKTNEIISLLSGKIPLKKYKYARLSPPDSKNIKILELSRPWRGVVERISINEENIPTGFEMVKNGKIIYKVSLNDYKNINGFSLPYKLLIETENASCKIKITNYFTNPEIKTDTFIL